MEKKMAQEEANDRIIDSVITRMLHAGSYDLAMNTTEIVRKYREQIFNVKQQSQDLEKLYKAVDIPVLSQETSSYRGNTSYYIGCKPTGEEMSNIGTYTCYESNRNDKGGFVEVQPGLDNAVYRYYEGVLSQFRMELLREKARLKRKGTKKVEDTFELE